MAKEKKVETSQSLTAVEWSKVRERLVTLSEKLDSVRSHNGNNNEQENAEQNGTRESSRGNRLS
jgi:hypothetical protein